MSDQLTDVCSDLPSQYNILSKIIIGDKSGSFNMILKANNKVWNGSS
jgi:hypothetical protein